MSECVVRMDMPKDCWDCPCVNGEYGYCQVDKEERQIEDPNGRPSWCPIICALPEGHGRLVDADANAAVLEKCAEGAYLETGKLSYAYAARIFREAPTIVPAEAERSET